MRLLHTADWHLGRLFHNVSLLEDQRHVLEQLIKIIDQESVDAVLIAGDVYDRSVPPAAAVTLLDDVLGELCQVRGLPVVIISGNHDGAERLRFGARHLRQAGLHILSDLADCFTPVTLTLNGRDIDIFGVPYADPEYVRSQFGVDVRDFDSAHRYLLECIDKHRHATRPTVLMSHCFVDGGSASDSERPLTLGGAESVAWAPMQHFNYVALGHLHGPQYRGGEHIRYSGSLLKYSFSEAAHRKGVTLVDIDQAGSAQVRQLPLMPRRDVRVLEGELEALLAQGKHDPKADDYLLVRLMDRHAILDPMGKLRAVYPNVLHLEKPGMLGSQQRQQLDRDRLRFDALDMFSDFFEQTSGEAMTSEQASAMSKLIAQLQRDEEQAP
ncbi:exonuclease SbcCD subunit D [Vreelandella populi]|uniref:Nuclease SbcCD subunit D n=1 Tax=Vreelandella populi TaxID=2498858 RepID=A0A433LG12_9GAMM|nr:exonuclease SbcCD subunit D [Halomonas populi]RUR37878.1 exonuclease SbcCD subunit D [Halomonas populi]RUR48856.1 exonuclease SbcCD subunit D [Halomonas populi]RUR55200.1 exonuclease SbcCD subunit D [Halomonas populi]